MLANKYKQYIETEDYTEIAQTISKQFFLQFEVFEGALERDIMMFFKDPLSILKQNVEAAQLEIQEDEQHSNVKKQPRNLSRSVSIL